jgi:cytochrome c biogenesis protein
MKINQYFLRKTLTGNYRHGIGKGSFKRKTNFYYSGYIMTDKKTNPLWNILKSVKLTLFLLSILAIVSIIGTLIQQQDGAGIYHSIWFRLIIFCLSINLIVCSVDRFPATLKLFRLTPNPDRSKLFDDATPRTILLPGTGVEQTSSAMQGFLRGRFNNLAVKENGSTSFIYCEKGRFSLFSVYLVHLSVLFILIGAIIGSIFGFSGYVNIPEGGSIDSAVITDGEGHGHRELGFTVRCEKFLVDFYDNGSPKEYRSELSFIVNGQEALNGSLRVNHPITFMGVTFYQSSYGTVPGEKVRLKAINKETGTEEAMIEAELGKTVMLPDNKGELILSDIKDNFMNMMGPAVLITVKSPNGQETPIWLFQDRDMIKSKFSEMFELSPKFNPSAYSPFTFELNDMESVTYTGLQVSRDPGVKFVFVGFILIIAGLFLTFFTSQRRFWIRIKDENGEVKISLAGTASKNPVGMERDLDRLLLKLKKVTGEGGHNG